MVVVTPYVQLATQVRLAACASGRAQYFIALCGGPGAGKSTLAANLCAALGDDVAVMLPMDGFHHYRRELDAFDDPDVAHARRGAPFTFDGAKFASKLVELHALGEGTWPSFDHAVGDPVEDDIRLEKRHAYVIVEGNYVLLDQPPWRDVRQLFDERWLIFVPEEVARQRVAARNAAAWGWSLDKSLARVDSNDVPNMRLVASSAVHADRVLDGLALERGELSWTLQPRPAAGPAS
jgi:pantothenate kinase